MSQGLNAKQIVESVKLSKYKFTKAQEFRDKLRLLTEVERERISNELKRALGYENNVDVRSAIREILF